MLLLAGGDSILPILMAIESNMARALLLKMPSRGAALWSAGWPVPCHTPSLGARIDFSLIATRMKRDTLSESAAHRPTFWDCPPYYRTLIFYTRVVFFCKVIRHGCHLSYKSSILVIGRVLLQNSKGRVYVSYIHVLSLLLLYQWINWMHALKCNHLPANAHTMQIA
jgi:hypothetical protein